MPDQTVSFDDERPDLGEDQAPSEAVVGEVAKKPTRTARAALSLALAGASNVDIADQLGYASPEHARAAWEGVLAKAYEQETDYEAFRKLQSARMNRQLQTISARAFASRVIVPDPKDPKKTIEVANDDQLSWLREFRASVESLSRLHGLEAPKVMALVTPDAKELDRVVSVVANAINKGEAIEGDIFRDEDIVDAEIVDE